MPTLDYPDSPDKSARRLQIEAQRVVEQEQRREISRAQGRIAWEDWEKTGSQNLTVGDRQEIARRLGILVARFSEERGRGSKTLLLQGTDLDIKDYEGLTTKEGNQASKELYAGPTRYRTLIHALATQTNEELHILADQVLLNTSFHPVSKDDLDEAKLILDALQVTVDRIDQEYKLWEQCKAVAAIRDPLERRYIEAVKSDNGDVAISELYSQQEKSPIKWWPLEELRLHRLDSLVCPDNAFWISSNPHDAEATANVVCDESVFFFPHAYLGPAIEWYGGRPDEYAEDYRWREINSETEPFVRFESDEYRVYIRDSETGNELANGDDLFMWGDCADGMGETARWLVIYPDHEAKRLVPALFTRGVMMNTELIPLTARLIAEFGDSTRWQCRDNTPNLLQRLRDLTGFGSGKFKIMDDWRETAARFHLNPIFRAHPGEAKSVLYRHHLEKWIKEGRTSLNSPANS
jgi:hypothetical protein